MKILDRYILKSFLITFTSVFVILFFIFVLQGIWLFISELAGKNLDFMVIIKFLVFYSPKIVPLVLPLSILLASIMTFGSFAENYEFAAMKSAGISLGRAMKALTVFIFLLSFAAFFFANNIIPKAEYKFINLRKDILQTKPAMAIAEGQFNTIGNSNIKVDKKSGENGELLEGVTMHVKSNQGFGNKTVIKAKSGELKSEEGSNILKLDLIDGYYYEDIYPKKYEEQHKMPFAKANFKKYRINIDLTNLNKSEEAGEIVNTNTMLNVNELNFTIDSLQTSFNKDVVSFTENISQGIEYGLKPKPITTNGKFKSADDILASFSKEEKNRVYESALNNISSTDFSIQTNKNDLFEKQKNINKHWIALHEKFVVAFSCLLMFFIGAPLGAIIRKGGLGLPIVFAVLIFITFHFINTFGKKVAQENGMPPFLGTWLSSFILTPLAVSLTYRATNDIGVMVNFDWITEPIMKLFSKKENGVDQFKKEIVSLDSLTVDLEDEEYAQLNGTETSVLKGIIKNSDQFGYSADYRLKTLKILEQRGITQDELLLTNNLYNSAFLKLQYYSKLYKKQSFTALIFYLLSFVFSVSSTSGNPILIILGLVNLILLYSFIYKSSESLNEISVITNRDGFTNTYLSLLLGFPFFIFIYFYNKNQLKETLSEFNE